MVLCTEYNVVKLATPGSSRKQKAWSIKTSSSLDDDEEDGISGGATKRVASEEDGDENVDVNEPRAKVAARKSTRGGSSRREAREAAAM